VVTVGLGEGDSSSSTKIHPEKLARGTFFGG
jgi:hypothetical protein